MKIKQLSVFLENRSGQLSQACATLADAGCNIVALSLADTNEFGILRLIVEDYTRAEEVLAAAGNVVNLTEVVAIEVPDHPGGLAVILDIIDHENINIEFMYAFTFHRQTTGVIVFRFENPDLAIETLRSRGVNLIDEIGLFQGR